MIKVHFFDWNSSALDIEKELNIDIEVDEFLIQNIEGIQLDCTDNVADMENNTIYWFVAVEEKKKAIEISDFLNMYKRNSHKLNFSVTVE